MGDPQSDAHGSGPSAPPPAWSPAEKGSSRSHSAPAVVVVGAGPVGLALALALSHQGVAVRVIERRTVPVEQTRAMTVQPRTLEVLQPFAVTARMVAEGVPVTCLNFYRGRRRCARLTTHTLPTPFPFVLQLPQPVIERILGEAALAAGAVLDYGTAFTALEQHRDGVRVHYQGPSGASGYQDAAFAVGCDGSRSAVRQVLGIPFPGSPLRETFIMGDVRSPGFPLDGGERHTFLGTGTYFVVMPVQDETLRVVTLRPPGDASTVAPTVEELSQRLEEISGLAVAFHPVGGLSRFRPSQCLAGTLGAGRVFLAGDAAHIHSPVGAQGLNSGIQDAVNLAWKLAWVVKGQAGEALLDTFVEERHAAAVRLQRSTADATRRISDPSLWNRAREALRYWAYRWPRPARAHLERAAQLRLTYRPTAAGSHPNRSLQPGDRAPAFGGAQRQLPPMDGRRFLLLIFADGPEAHRLRRWVDSQYPGQVATLRLSRNAPGRRDDLAVRLRKQYGIRSTGMALIRPDGHVSALLPLDEAALAHDLDRALGRR